jgi:hypothetical protein
VPLLDTLLEVFAPNPRLQAKCLEGARLMNVSHGLSDQDKDGLSQRVSKQPQPPSESAEKQTLEDEEMLLRSEFPAGQAYRPDEL